MAKEIEMRADAKKGFTQMNKNGNVENRVWVQMAKADPIVPNQISEEGMNKNPKPAQEIILKYN